MVSQMEAIKAESQLSTTQLATPTLMKYFSIRLELVQQDLISRSDRQHIPSHPAPKFADNILH